MPVQRLRLVLVPCQIERSAFSGERVFRLPLADGGEYIGAASLDYCYGRHGRLLGTEEPSGETPISGSILGRVIREEADRAWVSVPDGAVVVVKTDQFAEPREVSPDVLV